MPDAKRPRGTSRGTTSRSKSSSSSSSRSTGRARGASAARGTGGRGTTKRPAAKPATRREELEPLDLEGTDFEELLDASSTPRGARAAADAEDLDDGDDIEEELDDTEEEDAPEARPRFGASSLGSTVPARTADTLGASGFGASSTSTGGHDPITPLSERFGAGGAADPVAPWAGLDDDTDALNESKPLDDWLVAILGLALALFSSIVPWYTSALGELSGIAAGRTGVLTFVAGVGAFVIALLRRSKVSVGFPLQQGVVIEALAYLGVAGAILARFAPFQPASVSTSNVGTLGSVALGVALVFAASRLSSGAPLVLQPGWFAGRGGRLGAVLLVLFLVLAGGLVVLKPGAPSANQPTSPAQQFTTTPPPCLTDVNFPILAQVNPGQGYFTYDIPSQTDGEPVQYCGGNLESPKPVSELRVAYLRALDENGWTAKISKQAQPTKGLVEITLTKPSCGKINLTDTSGNGKGAKTQVTIVLGNCALFGVPQPTQ